MDAVLRPPGGAGRVPEAAFSNDTSCLGGVQAPGGLRDAPPAVISGQGAWTPQSEPRRYTSPASREQLTERVLLPV